MKPASIEDEVIKLIADYSKFPAERISPQTTLFGDIGIDGDDGDELLTRFMEEFQVDMSLIRPVHFGGEGLIPWAPLLWFRQALIAHRERAGTPESRAGLVPIRVQDLIDSARARRWVLNYEEEANQPVQTRPTSRPV